MTQDQVTALFNIMEAGYVPITGKTGYPEIKKLEKNSGIFLEILTRLGGGNHFLLGIIMLPDEYKYKTSVPFLRPTVNPPPFNTTIPSITYI